MDFIEYFPGEFSHVIPDSLQTVGIVIIDQTMPRHLTDGFMLVYQLQQTVVVTVQIEFNVPITRMFLNVILGRPCSALVPCGVIFPAH